MSETIEFLKHYSPLISILTFLAGLYFGNRQAIGRDRRKEFNELAEPIIENLNDVQEWLERQIFIVNFQFELQDSKNIEKLKRRLSNRELKRFEKLLGKYRASLQALIESPEPVIHFGMTEEEEATVRNTWINYYPVAISNVVELIKFLRLR